MCDHSSHSGHVHWADTLTKVTTSYTVDDNMQLTRGAPGEMLINHREIWLNPPIYVCQ